MKNVENEVSFWNFGETSMKCWEFGKKFVIFGNVANVHDTCGYTFLEYTTTHSPAAVKILIFGVFARLPFPFILSTDGPGKRYQNKE